MARNWSTDFDPNWTVFSTPKGKSKWLKTEYNTGIDPFYKEYMAFSGSTGSTTDITVTLTETEAKQTVHCLKHYEHTAIAAKIEKLLTPSYKKAFPNVPVLESVGVHSNLIVEAVLAGQRVHIIVPDGLARIDVKDELKRRFQARYVNVTESLGHLQVGDGIVNIWTKSTELVGMKAPMFIVIWK